MKRFPLIFTLLATCLTAKEAAVEHSKKETQKECGDSPKPYQVNLRHIEANGIGYSEGYTTIEGFLTPEYPNRVFSSGDTWVPFLDLRFHVFNDGKPALNTGLGIRYLTQKMVWGANAYYDYRKTSRRSYNQVGAGFEGLGRIWDFRINGYLPVGTTESSWYHTQSLGFQGHYWMMSQKREFALKGFNAEAGIHINEFKNAWVGKHFKNTPFYVAFGPYYLNGHGKNSWGASARFTLDLWDYIRLEGNSSYDDIYHGVGQGQLTFMIPFGSTKKVKTKKKESCYQALVRSQRAQQRVDRFEIIPTKKKERISPAINPATGDPYFFWFVNNTSHSLGTFESPFPTLLMAQNASNPYDVIYVYPGDGTDKGMNVGIVLKDNQLLLSTSLPHSFTASPGSFTVPAMSTGMPKITNKGALNNPVITLASNNELQGLSIHDLGSISAVVGGTAGQGPMTNLLLGNSIIVSDNNSGVFLIDNPNTGNINIYNSTITAVNDSGIYLQSCNQVNALLVTNASIIADLGITLIQSNVGPVSCMNCSFNTGFASLYHITNNIVGPLTFTNTNISSQGYGILAFIGNLGPIEIANSSIASTFDAIQIEGCVQTGALYVGDTTITSSSGAGLDLAFNILGPALIENNTITTSNDGIVYFENDTSDITILNNTISVTGVFGDAFEFENNSAFGPITIENSILQGNNYGVFLDFNDPVGVFSIDNCTITGSPNAALFDSNGSMSGLIISNSTFTSTAVSGLNQEALSVFATTNTGPISITNSIFTAGRNGIDFVQNGIQGNTTITNCTISAGSAGTGNGIDFVNIPNLGTVLLQNCQVSTASVAGIGINFDQIISSNPTTIDTCNVTVPLGPRGISFTNTPNNASAFRLNLYNDVVNNSPPLLGYFINNPGPGTFNLQLRNDTGSTSFTNVTIIP